MKLNRKTRLQIIVGIAGLFIVYGILDWLLHFNINPQIVSNVGMVLMILAFGLLFSRSNEEKKDQGAGNQNNNSLDGIDRTDAGSDEEYPSAMENDIESNVQSDEGIDDNIDTQNTESDIK